MKKILLQTIGIFIAFIFCLDVQTSHAQATCATATVIPSVPYVISGRSNCGNANTYSGTPACLTAQFFGGEDYVFSYTPTANQCIDAAAVFVNGTAPYQSGMAVLNNCPTTPGAVCVATNTGAAAATSLIVRNVSLTAGTT
jgi:hypothetical protein